MEEKKPYEEAKKQPAHPTPAFDRSGNKNQEVQYLGVERSPLQEYSRRGKTELVLPSSYRMKDYQDLREQTKLMRKYISATHHLENLREMETSGPRVLRRVSAQLQTIVVLASPNVITGWKLNGNARNWLLESLKILPEHYQKLKRDVLQELAMMDLSNGNRTLEVAVRWARRNLKRIRQDTIERA